MEVIQSRLPQAKLIVPPTALEELGFQISRPEAAAVDAAHTALSNLFSWGYEPLNMGSVGKGIVQQIGLRLRLKNIVPHEEQNGSLIIAEAAVERTEFPKFSFEQAA